MGKPSGDALLKMPTRMTILSYRAPTVLMKVFAQTYPPGTEKRDPMDYRKCCHVIR